MCFHNAKVKYDNTIKTKSKITFNVKNKDYFSDEVLLKWSVPTASIIYNKDIVKTIARSDKFLYGDIILILSCMEYGKCRGLSDIMSIYRRHDGGALLMQKINESYYDNLLFHYSEIGKVFTKISSKTINYLSCKMEVLKSYNYFRIKAYKIGLKQMLFTFRKYKFLSFKCFIDKLFEKIIYR